MYGNGFSSLARPARCLRTPAYSVRRDISRRRESVQADDGAVIVGRVVRLDSPSSIDVVNNNGGGIYTIKTTQASREAAIAKLKVGELHHRQCVPDYRHLGCQVRPVRQGIVRLLSVRNLAGGSRASMQGVTHAGRRHHVLHGHIDRAGAAHYSGYRRSPPRMPRAAPDRWVNVERRRLRWLC